MPEMEQRRNMSRSQSPHVLEASLTYIPGSPMQVARYAARASAPRSVRTQPHIGCDCCTVIVVYPSRPAVLLTSAVRARRR